MEEFLSWLASFKILNDFGLGCPRFVPMSGVITLNSTTKMHAQHRHLT